MTTTGQMRKAIESDKNVEPFPEEFIRALECLLNTGLSCAQITSFLIVLQGMSELQDVYEEGVLLGKSIEVLQIMRHLRAIDRSQRASKDTLDQEYVDKTWMEDD